MTITVMVGTTVMITIKVRVGVGVEVEVGTRKVFTKVRLGLAIGSWAALDSGGKCRIW